LTHVPLFVGQHSTNEPIIGGKHVIERDGRESKGILTKGLTITPWFY
jgi:hypothetical protein